MTVTAGGQTGVDRATLDAALAAGLPVGGWCPAGRWAEDGPIDSRYPLRETGSADPAVRTRRNVEAADALLVLAREPAGGTALALHHARALGRPVLVVDPTAPDAAERIGAWLDALGACSPVVNVAGPRESERPGVYRAARTVLDAVFTARPAGAER